MCALCGGAFGGVSVCGSGVVVGPASKGECEKCGIVGTGGNGILFKYTWSTLEVNCFVVSFKCTSRSR